MSRFIDKLKDLFKTEVQPMGFMAGKVTAEKPRMQLVARIPADNLDKVSGNLSSADAVLVDIAGADDIGALEKVCQVKGGAPAGGWLKSSNGALKKLMNTACDFVVFPAAASLSATQKDKLGRVLELDAASSEGLLRTVNDLPVDAVLISAEEEIALTFNRLMLIQRVIHLVSKPVLVPISAGLGEFELQTLWDMGVSSVVVEAKDEKSAEKLANLHKTLEKLNPPAVRKKSRLSPVLPRLAPEAPPPPEEEGGEEDE